MILYWIENNTQILLVITSIATLIVYILREVNKSRIVTSLEPTLIGRYDFLSKKFYPIRNINTETPDFENLMAETYTNYFGEDKQTYLMEFLYIENGLNSLDEDLNLSHLLEMTIYVLYFAKPVKLMIYIYIKMCQFLKYPHIKREKFLA